MTLALILDQVRGLAEARGHAVLLARAATELPGITATLDPAGIRLTARHLHARAFGTRHRRRDPRLALFTRSAR
jgi:hypothetical protein